MRYYEVCESCEGFGGYDATTDCEVYDDWQGCEACNGTGKIEIPKWLLDLETKNLTREKPKGLS